MKTDRYIIWRDIALMDFEEEDSFKKETMENYNLSPDDVEEIQDLMYNINEDYLYDERYNLSSINLPDTILAIADLGLWSGRCSGYREFDSIQDCLYTNDDGYAEWYVDTYGNFKCMFSHHDGTNYYEYRMWKPTISDTQRENLLDKIYRGEATKRDICHCTVRLGDMIAKVFGWKFKGRKPIIA